MSKKKHRIDLTQLKSDSAITVGCRMTYSDGVYQTTGTVKEIRPGKVLVANPAGSAWVRRNKIVRWWVPKQVNTKCLKNMTHEYDPEVPADRDKCGDY